MPDVHVEIPSYPQANESIRRTDGSEWIVTEVGDVIHDGYAVVYVGRLVRNDDGSVRVSQEETLKLAVAWKGGVWRESVA